MASSIYNGINIWFSNKPTDSGVYRYDVMVNGEIVFIGNTYLEGGKNPIIDITDIVKNYVDVNKPPFSSIGEKSNVYKNVSVKLYFDGSEHTQSTDKFMIYENPYFNSNVSTPILDNFVAQNIVTMPMLQGWDYNAERGYLVPTYPAVASNNITFDMVCGYQNMPIINDFSVNYDNGLIDKPKYIQVSGGGVYQYSLPLSWLLRGMDGSDYVFDTITDLFNFSTFAPYYRYEDTVDEVEGNEFLKRVYTNTRYEDGNVTLPVINQYTRVYYTNGTNEVVKFKVVGDSDGADNYFIQYEFSNILDIDHIDVYMEYDDGGEDTLTITPNVTNWTMINSVDNATDKLLIDLEMKPDGGYSVNEKITITTDKIVIDMVTVACNAKSMDIFVFSPINSNQRYKYTIANFDNQSRYFLKWKDRYGMPQVQPFGGTYKYGESIKKNTVVNYLNTKKIIDISNTSKWVLNTKWIKQEYYPFYESIFVSPYLQLYDAVEDKIYNVILKNTEYDEKTFNNQNKQLFNLQLEVELDTTEYMIY